MATVRFKGPPETIGASSFVPDGFLDSWTNESLPQNNDLRSSISQSFNLPENDNYVYHATASVTLSQVQNAINYGGANGMHAWYIDEEGKQVHIAIYNALELLSHEIKQ